MLDAPVGLYPTLETYCLGGNGISLDPLPKSFHSPEPYWSDAGRVAQIQVRSRCNDFQGWLGITWVRSADALTALSTGVEAGAATSRAVFCTALTRRLIVTSANIGPAATLSFGGIADEELSAPQFRTLPPRSRIGESAFTHLISKAHIAQSRLPAPVGEKLTEFTKRLALNEVDYAEEGISPSVETIDGLVRFMLRHRSVRMPGLTLTEEGKIAAFWDRDRTARIRLDFIDAKRAKWVIVRSEGLPAFGTGEVDIDALDFIIEAYQAKDWMVG